MSEDEDRIRSELEQYDALPAAVREAIRSSPQQWRIQSIVDALPHGVAFVLRAIRLSDEQKMGKADDGQKGRRRPE